MFKAPAGVAVAVGALLLAAWLLSNSSRLDARDSVIAAGIGLLIYVIYRLVRPTSDVEARAD
jgi:hypothetical protein